MKTYMGITIYRCSANSSGMRWFALTDSGRVMADTLAGVKELIKERVMLHRMFG